MYTEIKVLRNVKTNRIVLVDRKTGQAFASYGKKDEQHKFFNTYHEDIIEDFKPSI